MEKFNFAHNRKGVRRTAAAIVFRAMRDYYDFCEDTEGEEGAEYEFAEVTAWLWGKEPGQGQWYWEKLNLPLPVLLCWLTYPGELNTRRFYTLLIRSDR